MERKELLYNARQHCFFVGVGDGGAKLCEANMIFGMASLHYLQKLLGIKPNATFISTPDMTVTRNANRWKYGFGYGGKITWGDGSLELIPLNVMPNACGMLVGGIHTAPDCDELLRKFHTLSGTAQVLDGSKIQWDFAKSNHFIDLFEVTQVHEQGLNIPRFVFVIHSSPEEFKGDNPLGFGLYYEKSKALKRVAKTIATPFGKLHVLSGKDAVKYYNTYIQIEDFAKKKRTVAAQILFGDYLELCNETHQGLTNMNEIILGCHYISPRTGLLPLMLRWDMEAYLVRGVPNLTMNTIETLGFKRRAQSLGVTERLLKANIAPHGGGYTFPSVQEVLTVKEFGTHRYFEIGSKSEQGSQIIRNVRDLPYDYRGKAVLHRALALRLLTKAVTLKPILVIKS